MCISNILEVVTSTPKLPKSERPEILKGDQPQYGSKDDDTSALNGNVNSMCQTPGGFQQNLRYLEPPSFLADSSDIDVDRQVPPLNLSENRFPEKQDTPEKDVDSMEDQQNDSGAPESDKEIATPIFTSVVEALKRTENDIGNNGSPCLTPVFPMDGHTGKIDPSCRVSTSKPLLTNKY